MQPFVLYFDANEFLGDFIAVGVYGLDDEDVQPGWDDCAIGGCAIPKGVALWAKELIVGDATDVSAMASVGIEGEEVARCGQVVVEDEIVAMSVIVGRKGWCVNPKVIVRLRIGIADGL